MRSCEPPLDYFQRDRKGWAKGIVAIDPTGQL